MSRREIRRGIRWCKANLSAACCRTARLPQALPPRGGDFAKYARRVGPSLLRRVPSGSPSGKPSGKRKVYIWPQLSPSGKKKTVHSAPTLPFGRKKKSVHLAPTLLRERRGDLTVRGGLRAGPRRS